MRTSTKMKKKLRKKYPDAKFKVRKKSSSLHKAFTVYTDLIEEHDRQRFRELNKELDTGGLKGEKWEEYKEIQEKIEENRRITKEIKDLLSEFWHVDRDSISGEILSGGNVYLSVEPWRKTKYL